MCRQIRARIRIPRFADGSVRAEFIFNGTDFAAASQIGPGAGVEPDVGITSGTDNKARIAQIIRIGRAYVACITRAVSV